MKLVHSKNGCQGWKGVYCDHWPFCRVWRSTVFEEALDNLKSFFAKRAPGNVQDANERISWPYQARVRRKVIRKLVNRRIKRYARAWNRRKLQPLKWGVR